MRYEFLCHAKNMTTGSEWIEMWGGKRGYESVMSCQIDAVRRAH